jgi:phosphohistidine phosphatase
MILTIWRHGQAEDSTPDRQRVLTESGRDDVGFGCHQFHEACLARKIPHPHNILHSDWLRTTQTAEILAAAFSHATVTSEDALLPGSDVAAVDAALMHLVANDDCDVHVVLVSHQPLVSRLVDHYLGERTSVPSLSAGGLATLSLAVPGPAAGTLLFWALPPEYEAGK